MDELIALVFAVAAVILPFLSFQAIRTLRGRIGDLEGQVRTQGDEIRALRLQLTQLRDVGKTAAAPPPSPPPLPAARPVVPPLQPAAVAPPARVVSPPPPPPPPPPRPLLPKFDWSFDSSTRLRVDWEQLVGVKLFSAIAGIALVFAAVFFLRYSIEHGWLQPPVRLAIGVTTAVALLVLCERKAARQYPITANALDAAAIAILFATFFAAYALWQLIPGSVAFGLLALVTATAVLLSVRHESLFVAVLGLLGGFATPVLLSTGENRPIGLFSYLILLNVGLAWVAYVRGWTALSILTVLLTTAYQWGWVVKFLATSSLPLALGIFLVFPLVTYAGYLLALSRPETREHAGHERFEWVALASSVAPLFFALYLATAGTYGQRYELLFGFLLLVTAGLLAIAVTRRRELLHAVGAAATLVVTASWVAMSYPAGAWLPFTGFVVAFMALYLAGPVIAERAGRPFGAAGRNTMYTAPLLAFVFPVLAAIEPAVASPTLFFAIVFAVVLALAWRALATRLGSLYYGGVFFALATEAVWSAKYLTLEALNLAVAWYAAFGLLYLGVPLYARRQRRHLEPAAAGGVILIASLLLLLFLVTGSLAAASMWGLALLLVIMTAAIFVESVAAQLPATAIVGSAIAWLVLLAWWMNAAAAVGPLPSWLMVIGLTCLVLAGHAWARRAATRDNAAAGVINQFRRGTFVALAAFLFLLAGPAVPPWPLFGALAVVALATSVAALAERQGLLHAASSVFAAAALLSWVARTDAGGYALVAVGAEAVLIAFALSWIPLSKPFGFEAMAAIATAVVIGVAQIAVMSLVLVRPQPPLVILVSSHVVGLSLLLMLSARYAWTNGATIASGLGALVALSVVLVGGSDWRLMLAHGIALYAPFAIYPLVLGARARENRDPFVAAIVASVWSFFAVRRGINAAGYQWMIGIVPVALGAVMTLHVRQLLRIQPAGARDLGRLALVAGTALAFATVAIPLQLSHQWITIGWALEGAAVAWLYRRVPHRGLLYAAAGLLGAVFVRLALNPEVFRYAPRGAMRILNWYLYAYLICAAAMFLAAWWLAPTDDRLHPRVPRLRHLLPAAGGILLFLLLNIEIADYYATGPEIMFRFGSRLAQDLTYTIGWLIFGLATLAAGIVWRSRAARVASVALITVTALKCFLYDLGSLEGLYRVVAFVGLALSLTLVSLALQKFVLARGRESAQ